MTVDPDHLAERQTTVPREELELADKQSLGETATVDDQLLEKLNSDD